MSSLSTEEGIGLMTRLLNFKDREFRVITIDGKDVVVEGRPRCVIERGVICISILKPESSMEKPILDLAALKCIEDAFERLARTGEVFATVLKRGAEWGGPAKLWSLWPCDQ